ncbi:MAG TPA: hypothetical protein VKB80_14590 [Kofleriaceae bacterium]|nr:hypothetical protein [Kofleriaceae bacterium]
MAKRSGSRSFTVLFLSTVLIGGAGACGGDDDDGGDTGNVDGGGGGSDAGVGGGGDNGGGDNGGGGGGGGAECNELLCLDPPAEGFQIQSVGGEINPGEDIEYCEVVQLPGGPDDTYYVNGFESAMTKGSHHLIVAAIIPGSPTDAAAQVGDRVECITASAWGDDLTDVTGQQLPEHSEHFPAGVGKVYQGGQKVVFDYHYFNATDDKLQAKAAVNFLTTTSDNIEHEAVGFASFNFGISIPPHESASFDNSCRMNQDVMVLKLTRHTHQWGVDFPVSFNDGQNDPELIYTSPNYEDPDFVFEEPILVEAGQGFDFTCAYNNDTDRRLHFGTEATDEMCILFGSMYSPTDRTLPPGTACE